MNTFKENHTKVSCGQMAWCPAQGVYSGSLSRKGHSALPICVHTWNLPTHLRLSLPAKIMTHWASRQPTVVTWHIPHRAACACLKAHPQFRFQLAAPRKAVTKAVAKEHSDVTERLQPKLEIAHYESPVTTTNSHGNGATRGCHSHLLSPHRHHCKPQPPPTHYLSYADWRWDCCERGLECRTQGGSAHALQLRAGHVQITLYHQKRGRCKVNTKMQSLIKKGSCVCPHLLSKT